ncbi:MAG: IclR family transcriptional regulator [Clostridiales bacterium]|jgi:DNA-binding IclR family transcriptional regulator|nr:IclR family transcriptional regulator [Clostridiales bacterium]
MTEDKNPIQVAGRLFDSLEYLAEHGESGLAEIAAESGLNKSTTHRILSSLEYMGYVRQNNENGKYSLSLKIVSLASQLMSHVDINRMVRPYLKELSEVTGETVHFVEREGAEVVYIDKEESDRNTVRMVSHIGSRMPFYRTAVGKAIASSMHDEDVRKLWDSCKIEGITPHTITDYIEFTKTLKAVRKKGYALDNEENETGVRCIACPLCIGDDGTRYAFSVSAPVTRMNNERIESLSALMLKTKQDIENI